MNKYTQILAIILLFFSSLSHAQNYRRNGNIFTFGTPSGDVRLSFCKADMFRVQKSRDNSFPDNENWMVRHYDFALVEVAVENKSNGYVLTTDKLEVSVINNPFRLAVSNKQGKVLYEELPENNFYDDSVKVSCVMSADEHFFGFGQRMDFLDQLGKKVYLNVELGRGVKPAIGGKDILRANYCPVPYMMSTKGYGIFFHTGFPTEWDMGWNYKNKYSYKAFGGELDYYFIYGPDFYTMIDNYTDLTGKSPMLPRFAMGLHIGTYAGGTWKNEQETSDKYPVDLAKRLRKEKIPFDIMWLDSTWRMFNNDSYGNGGATFEWRNTFKDPKGMFDSLYAQNVKMVGLHIRSIIDNGSEYKMLDRAREAGILYPDAQTEGIVNFFDSSAVNWWWENAVMKIASIGAKFVKTDVGGTLSLKDKTPVIKGKESAELHNIYPLAYAEAPYNKFEEYNHMRGMTQTREGYAGIQRYPYIWAGDWGTEWQWFEPVIQGGLNIGMSGVGFWAHCMGGFEQYSPYDTELYIRWVQFGMLSPIAMLFGMDHPRYHEPWTYGQEAMDNFIKYDNFRYSLIPYIYSNAFQVYKKARPMITPLVMDYPDDKNTYNISRQYMFGPYMMVCPVTTKNALSQSVYFPGGEWFDYETGERYSGRQYKSLLTPLEVLPLYIKGGAIIPMQQPMQYVDQHPVKTITLDVYPSGQSSFNMYEDDGISLDYKKDIYAITSIKSNLDEDMWTLSIDKPKGKYKPSAHGYKIKAYWPKEPTMVTENGKKLSKLSSADDLENTSGWFFEASAKRLWVGAEGDNSNDIRLVVE